MICNEGRYPGEKPETGGTSGPDIRHQIGIANSLAAEATRRHPGPFEEPVNTVAQLFLRLKHETQIIGLFLLCKR